MVPCRPFCVLFVLLTVFEVPSQASRHSRLDVRTPNPKPGKLETFGNGSALDERNKSSHHPEEAHGHEHDGHEEHEHAGHFQDHEEHHHHAPPRKEAMFMSIMLMGVVAFILALFYLVNHYDDNIRWSTWRTLNMTISIFVSVLIYGMIRAVCLDVLITAGVEIDHTVMAVLCLTLFAILYPLLQYTLFQLRNGKDHHMMHAVGELFAHVTGFSAMFGFAALMQTDVFASSRYMSIVVLLLSFVVVGGLSVAAFKARDHIVQGDGVVDESEEVWMEVVEEAEDDVLCLCFSFILTAVVRTLIRGSNQPYSPEVEPKGVHQWQCNTIFWCAVGFIVLSLVTAKATSTYFETGEWKRRCGKITATTLAMAGAWCTLFGYDWQVYTWGYDEVRVSACLLVALWLTFLAIAFIFLIDFLADRLKVGQGQRTLRFMVVALGLLVGFAWEKSFDIAMEDVAHSGGLLGWHPGFTTYIQGIVLLIIVLPAWYMYILPQAIKAKHSEDHEGEAAKEMESDKAGEQKEMPVR